MFEERRCLDGIGICNGMISGPRINLGNKLKQGGNVI